MSVSYRPVTWNRNKWVYDIVLVGFVVAYILLFLEYAPSLLDVRSAERPILRMRAFGSCAFVMLTFILCIGPLARLDKRFLPLLYNRRHFGVMMCLVAFGHFLFVKGWYFAFNPNIDPYIAMLGANTAFTSWHGFPFEVFGVFALVILLVMAATSHDFWLSFLGPLTWKAIHMGVYLAYGSVILHITFGLLQGETHPFYILLTGGSFALVAGLHIAAGLKETKLDTAMEADAGPDWVPAGRVGDIPMDRAVTIVLPGGDRVAIFRYENKLSAISNLCAHQNGPLGEGRVIDGCVTCPWHGYQYRPEDGCSPPPFTEKVPTYRLRLDGETVLLDPEGLPPGTPVDPVVLPDELQ